MYFYVFFQAFDLSLYGPRYVWMLMGGFPAAWWRHRGSDHCGVDQLDKAVEGYFSIRDLNSISDSTQHAVSGMVRNNH